MKRRVILAILAFLAAMVVAGLFDRPLAEWVHRSGMPEWFKAHRRFTEFIKAPGEFYFVVIAAIVVAIAHPLRWRAGLFFALGVAVSGLNSLSKWFAGRVRPFKLDVFDASGQPIAVPFSFHPFRGGWHGALYERNLCFPSGHAAMSFAAATAVAMLWPRARWRWLGFAWAGIVTAERIAENAHWLSDCVAGVGLGVGGVLLVRYFAAKFTAEPNERTVPVAGDPLLQRAGERADAASAGRGVVE